MRCLFIIALLLIPFQVAVAADTLSLQSPHKNLCAKLYTREGRLLYQVQAGAQEVVLPSAMGIKINHRLYGTRVHRIAISRQKVIREVLPARLNAAAAVNHCVDYTISVNEDRDQYTIACRMFDNGCAFRYIIPGKEEKQVQEEITTFTFPVTTGVWYFERNNSWKLQSYAGLWQRTTMDQLPVVSAQGPIQGKPLVMELPGGKYAVITEAALYRYSGMRLKATGNGAVQVNYTEGDTGFTLKGELVTPWRTILYANNLNELVNNHVIENLNPRPDPVLFADTRYIKPGKSVWSWITRDEHYMEPAEELRFIDAAAELGFAYTLLDEGWETKWPDKWKQLKILSTSAAKKGIHIWVWKNSKEIRDSVLRNSFLDSVAMAGAVGIKTDFMNSEALPLIMFEEALLKGAAARKLMVNFHGCQAPAGESRTYPNEMTREGIRGMELNVMKEPLPAWHNAALPFTRFICGHGDYTPGLFSLRGPTTVTHQLALLYLFNSPFQCMAENPLRLLKDSTWQPILPLLKTLPVTWDETIVLPGSDIGKIAAFARRKGRDWYVAMINGTDSLVSFRLQPTFLRSGQTYKAMLITDTANGNSFVSATEDMRKRDDRKVTIPATGGLVVRIADTGIPAESVNEHK
ncbi:glycoside hydrolase family 97 catalytic domain-containing protein [Chitinophaga sp. 22321]|uniref:Glycoside hydrolase family 97 catalytic domain-containing protein n=1 Tax=Chitinophaga hostae TaxID=2831022 RepID=A0ABS5J5A7_9BACT|nr:glycoside hydrolase family 97 protein [Chitinophaga hostae]MBS0030398.1 glycoside hydrolase family 97 catalytic domain-containing protein [Chitinophaga hostae]